MSKALHCALNVGLTRMAGSKVLYKPVVSLSIKCAYIVLHKRYASGKSKEKDGKTSNENFKSN